MRQIMIVDDSPTDSHLLKKMLERNGFNTLTASDAGRVSKLHCVKAGSDSYGCRHARIEWISGYTRTDNKSGDS